MHKEELGKLIGDAARFRENKQAMGLSDLQALASIGSIIDTAGHLNHPDTSKPYGRCVVFAEDTLEAMVATWTPGIPSAPHDHGGSFGAVRVLHGRALHKLWKFEDGDLVIADQHFAEVGDILSCGPDLVHSVEDAGDGQEILRTLHLYTEAIDHMMVYDLESQTTYVVDGGCGAWVPHDQRELIRGEADGFISRADMGIVAKDDVLERMV